MQWEKDKKLKDDRILKEVEETLVCFYSSEGFVYINEERKANIQLLYDKKRHILLEKNNNGDLKVGHFGSKLEMTILIFFIDMQAIERTITSYGR